MRGRGLIGLLGAMALVTGLLVAGAGSAAGTTFVGETGLLGNYYLADTDTTPAATCGYGNEVPPNGAWFKWMKVQPPTVYAADRDSGVIDHRRVSWQFKIQTRPYESTGSWKTVAVSEKQKAKAYENLAAPFTAMRVDWRPHHSDPVVFKHVRALVIVKFYKPNGTVEGTAKFLVDWYKNKTPWWTPIQNDCDVYTTSG
jgi:hypothetical protein